MPTHRPERIAEMIHMEIAQRLLRDIKDPLLTPISITRVEVPRDLGCANVFYLPLGGGNASAALQEALVRAGKQIRGPIGRALRLRTAPELIFKFDVDHEQAVKVSLLLGKISQQQREAQAPEGEE
jgi:ribosome-binding factor A